MRTIDRMTPRRIAALSLSLAFLGGLAPELPAQQGGRQPGAGFPGRGRRPTADLETARRVLLEAETPTANQFNELVRAALQEATNRKLPSFTDDPEATYGEAYVDFRRDVYGPLLAQPATRELLRSQAREGSSGGFGFGGGTAALVLSDAPDEEDFAALLEGYRATGEENRASPARQLGRGIAAARAAAAAAGEFAALVDEALAQLRGDAAEGKPAARGAAIEALYRAGEIDEALAALKAGMAGAATPLDTVSLLQGCSRLLQIGDVDPFLRARAVATANSLIEEILAADAVASPTGVISGPGRTLRASITLLRDVGGEVGFDVLVRCLKDERARRLLGMDGLQNLRFALQTLRAKAGPERGEALDRWFLAQVMDAGYRLFDLEEQPMEREEQQAFWDGRDLRYNALSYLLDQFLRRAEVRAMLRAEPDLPELLAALYSAREDVVEDDGAGTKVWLGVADKLENRVLELQLLARCVREFGLEPAGVDVFGEALAILYEQTGATPLSAAELQTFRSLDDPALALEVAIGKAPDDPFVQNAAAQAIANLGFIVSTGSERVRITVDQESGLIGSEEPARGSPSQEE